MGMENFFRSSIPISLLVHLLVLAVAWLLATARPHPEPQRWVDIDLREDPRKSIVETEAGKNEVPTENAFLGKSNRKVEQEKVAKLREAENSGGAIKTFKNLGAPLLGPGMARKQDAPQFSDFKESFGDSKQEYIKGLKEGEQTALNTREFMYFTYFQRIREQLDRAWRPILRDQLEKLFRHGRLPASDREHTTRIMVTLDTGGAIVRVQVLEESGTHDLDDAAIRAFNRAGPFPNPPMGLLQETGRVDIRWDFILRT